MAPVLQKPNILGSASKFSTSYSCLRFFASTSPGEILWITCGAMWVQLGCFFSVQTHTRYSVCQWGKTVTWCTVCRQGLQAEISRQRAPCESAVWRLFVRWAAREVAVHSVYAYKHPIGIRLLQFAGLALKQNDNNDTNSKG